jgi:peptidoglycan/LPS O-acetylase OafA/YrhL
MHQFKNSRLASQPDASDHTAPVVSSAIFVEASRTHHRRADIQGMRGLAVLAVIVYHASSRLAPGGYVGVDIFFVISGFVISALIRNDLNRKKFSLRSFYRRRILRLYPALFVTLAATLTAGAFILSPTDLRELGRTAVSTIVFASNFDFMRIIGYFNSYAGTKPLLHMWSLAVEEQFYFFFPVTLMLAWKYFPRRVSAVIAGIFIASLGIELWFTKTWPLAAFYWPFCRAFEFAIGAFLAWNSRGRLRARWAGEILSIAGLALLAFAIFFFDDTTSFPGLAALIPCIGTALLIYSGPSGTVAGNALGLRVPRLLGDASYSLYLWHWPVIVFTNHLLLGRTNARITASVLLVSLVLGLLSRRFVEQPVLSLQKPEWPVFRLAAAGMGALASLGFALYITQGVPQRFSPQVLRFYASAQDANGARKRCHSDFNQTIPYADNCIFGDIRVPPDIAVWGDSYGAELSVALGEILAASHRSVMEITTSNCPPTVGYPASTPRCLNHNLDTVERLAADNRFHTVILVAHYASYNGADWPVFTSGFNQSLQRLRAAGKRVGILFPLPVYDFDPPEAIAHFARSGQSPENYTQPRAGFERDSRPIDQWLEPKLLDSGVFAIRPADFLCNPAVCRTYIPSAGVMYFDKEHLSISAARLILRGYENQLSRAF